MEKLDWDKIGKRLTGIVLAGSILAPLAAFSLWITISILRVI